MHPWCEALSSSDRDTPQPRREVDIVDASSSAFDLGLRIAEQGQQRDSVAFPPPAGQVDVGLMVCADGHDLLGGWLTPAGVFERRRSDLRGRFHAALGFIAAVER